MILSCILVDHAAEGFIIRRGGRRRIRHPKKPTGKQLAMEMAKFTDLLLVCMFWKIGINWGFWVTDHLMTPPLS